jgi:hypothetical protein
MDHVLQINQTYPGLVVAVSIEPENDMNHIRCLQEDCTPFADFSALAMEEWRQWLSHTGLYGVGGEFAGEGAEPWFPTIFDFNAATGSSFSAWAEVDPRSPHAGPAVWDMYLDGGDGDGEWQSSNPPGSGHIQGWCERMVQHRCEDSVNLLWEVAGAAGWSTAQIFTHQVPGGFVEDALNPQDVPFWGYGHRLCTLAACAVENGRPGITGFRETTVNQRLFEALRTQLSPDGAWANLEFNPLMHRYCDGYETDYDLWADAFRMNWESGAHTLCAFRWWVPPETSTWWANIRPDFHRPPDQNGDGTIQWESRLQATHDFVADDNLRFRPWSPQATAAEPSDYLPPTPRVGALRYDGEAGVISFKIEEHIYPGCDRLLWYDDTDHPFWPGAANVYGWPEFSAGRFYVYRDTVPSFQPGFSNLLGALTMPAFEFVDSALPGSAGVFYAVVAADNGGDRSEAARIWAAPQLLTADSLSASLWQNDSHDTTAALANIGLRPLVIDSVVSSVPWLRTGRYPPSILPDGSGELHLVFDAVGVAAGLHRGEVVIHSNDPFLPETVIAVSMLVEVLAADVAVVPGELVVTPQPAFDRLTLVWALGVADRVVSVELLDLAGRAVKRSIARSDGAGVCETHLSLGEGFSNGVYVVRLSAGGATVQRRLVVLR